MLRTKTRLLGYLAATICVSVMACAQGARELPADYRSVDSSGGPPSQKFSQEDLDRSCDWIASERARLDEAVQKAEAVIKGDRRYNQTVGYFAALFILPVVAVDTNDEQVEVINASKARIDELRELALLKQCERG